MCRYSEEVEAVIRVARSAGAETAIDARGHHPRVVITFNGETFFVVCSSTPSDVRGVKNAVAVARRLLGISGARPKSARPARRHRSHCRNRNVEIRTLSDFPGDGGGCAPDRWFGPLEALKARLGSTIAA